MGREGWGRGRETPSFNRGHYWPIQSFATGQVLHLAISGNWATLVPVFPLGPLHPQLRTRNDPAHPHFQLLLLLLPSTDAMSNPPESSLPPHPQEVLSFTPPRLCALASAQVTLSAGIKSFQAQDKQPCYFPAFPSVIQTDPILPIPSMATGLKVTVFLQQTLLFLSTVPLEGESQDNRRGTHLGIPSTRTGDGIQ